MTLRDQKFDGSDTISLFAFLQEIVCECNTLIINKGKYYFALSYLLKGSAKEEYTAVLTVGNDNDEGIVTCCPEAIKYLLRT